MIDETIISDYQATRAPGIDRSVLCHAPFTSLNFDQYGRARVCCYNWRAVLGTWPEMTLAEMWTGAQATALRQSFIDDTEATGCDLCFDQLRARNFEGARMHHFDAFSRSEGYRPELKPGAPRVIELELSNTCNLECIQCQSKWSSLIRKNRDHLPPLAMPYDETFVDQLEPFLPSLVEARFLGGEPMLIHLYHLIWERIRAVNPNIALSITTNGTVIPDRAFAALAGLRSHICLSIDSLDPQNFARIRKRGSLDVVLANFERWRAYTRERGTTLSLAVCPMTHNWRDLPEFLRFSERHDVPVSFNTVVRPWPASLASLPHAELDEVIAYLTEHQPAAGSTNAAGWASVIGQVRSWRDTRRELDQRFDGFIPSVRAAARSQAALLDKNAADDSAELVADAVARMLASSWLDRRRAAADSQAVMLWSIGDDYEALAAAAVARLRASSWPSDDPAGCELADRLRQMTPVASQEGEQPVQQMVLLRVLYLLRNLGLLVSSGPVVPAPINSVRLAGELEYVEHLVDSQEKPFDWKTIWWLFLFSRWDRLADWLNRLMLPPDTEAVG